MPGRTLNLEQMRVITHTAMLMADRWWVDVLDCSKSFARQRTEMPYQESMKWFTDKAFFNIIHRNTHPENHIEISFRAPYKPDGADIFLWIILDSKHAEWLESLVSEIAR